MDKTACTGHFSLLWCESTACLHDQYFANNHQQPSQLTTEMAFPCKKNPTNQQKDSLSKDLSSHTCPKGQNHYSVCQAYSQNTRLLSTGHHMDTNRLLGRGRQFHLSISPQTFPPLCSPAKTRGEKPQLLRATTGNNSRKFSTQNQFLQTYKGVLPSSRVLTLWPSQKHAAFVLLAPDGSSSSPSGHSTTAFLVQIWPYIPSSTPK